jgi:hypothetical protein
VSEYRVLTKKDLESPLPLIAKPKHRKLNAWIPADEYLKFKIIATQRGVTLTEIVNDLVRAYIRDKS